MKKHTHSSDLHSEDLPWSVLKAGCVDQPAMHVEFAMRVEYAVTYCGNAVKFVQVYGKFPAKYFTLRKHLKRERERESGRHI
jgi:hypothetical protein